MHFENLELHPSIMKGVHDVGYEELTPIQEKAIPQAIQGKDIIGLAQTGTGKTAAFILPILQKLIDLPRARVGAVIITPTRELAEQTNLIINKLAKYTGLKSAAIYGGTNINQQMLETGNGAEILVACPGRLIDHLWRGSIDLSELKMLVLDEADRMLDMGFLPDINKILSCILSPHQTMLFSATMPPNIRKLTKNIQTDPVTVKIGQTAPVSSVSHSLYPVAQHQKTKLLIEILRKLDSQSVIVFTRTKHRTEEIVRKLKQAGFRASSLQGDLSQVRRQAAIDSFRQGRTKILVATDIASRGIDILRISHVINYDMPENTDAYIHRIGRTGRVNMSGEAFTFVTGSDTAMVNALEKILNRKIDRITLENFDYSQKLNNSPVKLKRNRTPFRQNGKNKQPAASRPKEKVTV